MTDNSLRTAIAKKLFTDNLVLRSVDEAESHRFWVPGNSIYESAHENTDAVLAVLADPPDDVIERAAEAIDRACFGQDLPEAPIDLARAALAALVGGESDDETH